MDLALERKPPACAVHADKVAEAVAAYESLDNIDDIIKAFENGSCRKKA